jgi:hypothetical protein
VLARAKMKGRTNIKRARGFMVWAVSRSPLKRPPLYESESWVSWIGCGRREDPEETGDHDQGLPSPCQTGLGARNLL